MASLTLTPQNRSVLTSHIADFLAYTHTEAYRQDLSVRERRIRFFQKILPQRLDGLSEADVEEVLGHLWASKMWGNRSYLVRKILEENSLDQLQQNLQMLYTLRDDPEEAYVRFLRNSRYWGPASITEVLTYIYPQRCFVWNRLIREAIRELDLGRIINPAKYTLSKDEYARLNKLAGLLQQELEKAGVKNADHLTVVFFLFNIAKGITVSDVSLPLEGFDHDEIRDLIAAIGTNLGFDSETEVRIFKGARVDCVWRARIANLGTVTYVFEVHRSGSIDSLLLNLQKALSAPTVQKVIAVSDRVQLERIRAETEGLPESFRRALRLWDVEDVIQTARAMERVAASIEQLGLLEQF